MFRRSRGWDAPEEEPTLLPPLSDFSPTEYPWSDHGRERERLRRQSNHFAKRALIVAALVHFGIFGGFMIKNRRAARIIHVPMAGYGGSRLIELTNLQTISSQAPPPIQEKPKAPEPKPKAPAKTPKKVPQEGKVVVKPTKKPSPAAPAGKTPEKETSKTETALAAANPGAGAASGGSAGVTGIGVDNPNFQYAYYLLAVKNKISANWVPVGTPGKNLRAVLHFQILRDGRIEKAYVEEPSGRGEFDRSALSALRSAEPLPPLPSDFPDDRLGVHFGFTYAQ